MLHAQDSFKEGSSVILTLKDKGRHRHHRDDWTGVRSGSQVGSGGRAVERQTLNRGDGDSIPPTAVLKFRQFHSPHIEETFGRDTKSRWSLLSGVYARGSKRSHTGVNV